MTKKQAENINLIFKNTKTQIDKLKIELDSITKVKPTLVRDTVYKRGSILIPKGSYLLYNYNEKQNRYELDPNSIDAKGITDESSDRKGVIISSIGFITVITLFFILI